MVDESRVIRTMAGLRPYRRSGFVVRAEALGDKALVHNYGHGGGGITLSWGSSKLATELGLQGHSGPVAVIGSGVDGPVDRAAGAGGRLPGHHLHRGPAARHHLEHRRRPVPSLLPCSARATVTPEFRTQFTRALDYSWRRFQIMVGEDYGVRWLPTYVERDSPEEKLIATFPPVNRMLRPAEHPFPLDRLRRYDTMYVETGRYLRQMMRDIQIAGGKIEIRKFATPADIAACPRASSSTAPASAAATCSTTRTCTPPAASSRSSSRSPRSNMPSPATSATCSRGPTASSSAARSSSTNGIRRRSPRHRAHPRRQKRFFDSFRCTA